MRYNKIRKMDISNGEGIRVSIFMQGCSFNCEGCFNKETHDFNSGIEFTNDTINRILELSSKDYIVGLSILGGEPLHPKNIEGTTLLAKKFKEKYPATCCRVLSRGFEFQSQERKQNCMQIVSFCSELLKEAINYERV